MHFGLAVVLRWKLEKEANQTGRNTAQTPAVSAGQADADESNNGAEVMPEFQLNADRYGKHAYYKLSDFAKGYVEAMFFTNGDTGYDNESLLNDLGVEKLTREAVKNIARDCAAFQNANAQNLELMIGNDDGYDEARAGNDFWFSRQGHGVGYSDRDLGEPGEALQDAARQFGEAYPEVARGWIYHR